MLQTTATPLTGRLDWAKHSRLEHVALGAILVLSAFLNLFRLNHVGRNGLGNPYYAAGVQSMLESWHNFFYLAFDPAGFLALDKAPLAMWVQAASAKLFGFHGLSLLVPQAMAGVLSVYVLYRLVRRAYGVAAALIAALALAVMPISVVTNRTNFPDPWLVLTLLLAAWVMMRAVETGALGPLLAAAALVGVGFNIKMLQILLVVPALAVLYLACSPLRWRRRLAQAGLALLVAVTVSLPWVLAVELTPPGQRPYVGGSTTNSVIDLIFRYNGVERLWGEDFSFFLGPPGPLRLFNGQLGGQVSWLLPLAVVGALAAAWQVRGQRGSAFRASRRGQALILWSAWLVPQIVYFSVSTFYHRYYLVTMAPAIAALTGIGAAALWPAVKSPGRHRGWGFLGLVGCGAVQALILLPYPAWAAGLLSLVLGLCLAILLVPFLERRFQIHAMQPWIKAVYGASVLALFVAPTVWSVLPVVTCQDMTLPAAGPQARPCRHSQVESFLDRDLVAYLEQHRDGAQYLAATYDLGIAEMGILETGEPFMALGGYRGRDPILTVDQFAQLVAEGRVRYFLILLDGGERGPEQEAILEWVEIHCPPVPIEVEGIDVLGPCLADQE
jgi:4-amino-4-deoxy-L-arabinose transferase-like glycosyltransferase